MATQAVGFNTVRVHTSVLADAEKRLLLRIAARLPRWISSDHLTFGAAAAMAGVGACFWAGGPWLWLVCPLLFCNWFGDSLDGTLARVRRQERPRYGYYVDHVLDAFGCALLVGGLVLGRHLTAWIGFAFLSAYYLLLVEVALATHARGTFRLSFWGIGPTELRICLGLGTLQLIRAETVTLAGRVWLLFDAGAGFSMVGLALTVVYTAVRNSIALYREERL
jgi:phosphatidylglycerophosphate synthase